MTSCGCLHPVPRPCSALNSGRLRQVAYAAGHTGLSTEAQRFSVTESYPRHRGIIKPQPNSGFDYMADEGSVFKGQQKGTDMEGAAKFGFLLRVLFADLTCC